MNCSTLKFGEFIIVYNQNKILVVVQHCRNDWSYHSYSEMTVEMVFFFCNVHSCSYVSVSNRLNVISAYFRKLQPLFG